MSTALCVSLRNPPEVKNWQIFRVIVIYENFYVYIDCHRIIENECP